MAITTKNSCKQPSWPAERDFSTYDLISGGILGRMIRAEKLKDTIVVDIGPGRFCSALTEMAGRVRGIIPYAIAPHDPEIIPAGITFYKGSLPDEDFSIKNAQLITDIFAGVSYAMRKDSDEFVPSGLEVLIRLAGWLKPGGVLIACTEVKRLGTHEDHVRISDFFRKYMALVCLFEIYEKFTEGNLVVENQLRVIVRNEQTLDTLLQSAHMLFSPPKEKETPSTLPILVNPFQKSVIGIDLHAFLSINDTFLNIGENNQMAQIVADNPSLHWVALQLRAGNYTLDEVDFSEIRKAKLITDIFAHLAFYPNRAIESLIRYTLQLAPEGRLIVCAPISTFGNPETEWEKLVIFFKEEMGVFCTFESFHLEEYGQVCVRVVIERHQAYRDLVELAKNYIGLPSRGEVLWESNEENPALRMRIYETVFMFPNDVNRSQKV